MRLGRGTRSGNDTDHSCPIDRFRVTCLHNSSSGEFVIAGIYRECIFKDRRLDFCGRAKEILKFQRNGLLISRLRDVPAYRCNIIARNLLFRIAVGMSEDGHG